MSYAKTAEEYVLNPVMSKFICSSEGAAVTFKEGATQLQTGDTSKFVFMSHGWNSDDVTVRMSGSPTRKAVSMTFNVSVRKDGSRSDSCSTVTQEFEISTQDLLKLVDELNAFAENTVTMQKASEEARDKYRDYRRENGDDLDNCWC